MHQRLVAILGAVVTIGLFALTNAKRLADAISIIHLPHDVGEFLTAMSGTPALVSYGALAIGIACLAYLALGAWRARKPKAIVPAPPVDHGESTLAANQSGKRKVVVVIRERGGASVPAVFASESAAGSFIRARIAKGTTVHADESGAWDSLHERFEMKRINHQDAYSFDGVCTNQAEEYFSRLRRAEIGIHHHIAGAYLLRHAQENSWRDNRRVSNGDQVSRVAALAMKRGKSVDFTGYWQRHLPEAV